MSDGREYKRSIEKILADSRISKANLETLKKYDTQGVFQQITIGTRSQRLITLHQLALFVVKDFKKMKKEDIENYFSSLRDLQPKTWTVKGSFVKAFFKWLYNSDEYPSIVKWIKTSSKNNNHKLPTDLLTMNEVKAMIETADNPMEKALISILYESACRIGEILNLKIKDVVFDNYGCVIMVDGKTGMRRIRLIESSPDLILWFNNHPQKQNRESPLFINILNNNKQYGRELNLSSASSIIKKLSKRAGIKKRVHPHLFRHSRLTELARDFSESELKIIAGWTGNSKMATVYIHLTGGDIEKKMLEKNGLLNKANEPRKDILKPQSCPRCKEINPNTARFCYVCGMALDMRMSIDKESRELKEPQTDDVLTKGLMQFIIKNHPELVLEFFKENGLDDSFFTKIPIKNKTTGLVSIL